LSSPTKPSGVWAIKFGADYARRLGRKLPSHHDVWHLDEVVITINGVTDKLRSYGAAKRSVMPDIEHRSHKGLNNRAENSHVPIRKRERAMQGFRSWSGLQRFVPIFSAVRNLFVPSCAQRSAFAVRLHRLAAMAEWKSVTAATA
jgi:putative transposase